MAESPGDGRSTNFSHEDFVAVFSEHSRRVYRFILTLTANRPDADDVFQATSMVLFGKFNEFDPSIGTFYSWACRIAYLEMLNMRRRERKATTLSDEVLELILADLTQRSGELHSRESLLEDCIKKLPQRERQMIEDRYYHDLAPKQLADRDDCSVHAIYRALAKAHFMLRRCVDRAMAAG